MFTLPYYLAGHGLAHLRIGHYPNGRLAWQLLEPTDGQLIVRATVNLADFPHEGPDRGTYVLVRNDDEYQGLVGTLLQAGLIATPTDSFPANYTTMWLCPVVPFVLQVQV